MSERLIPVRSESEIRIGSIYVVKDARNEFGELGTVRFMILGREPVSKCINAGCGCLRYLTTISDVAKLCAPCCISSNTLFRVEGNLDLNESNPYTVSKPKERVKNER